MRSKLRNKLKLQDQNDPSKMKNAWKINPNIVQGLHKAEQQTVLVKSKAAL